MSLLKTLAASFASQPRIPVRASDIRVLRTPSDFYNSLLGMIKRARNRIFLSSLYIGTSETRLLQALHDTLRSNPRLHVYLHLDLLRSTRPGSICTASILSPLVSTFPDRVHVHLFRSPKLKGVLSHIVPRRFDEGWGTWHAKIYGVDNEVIISGANLNKTYFTNRQDRYLHFTSTPVFSNYCFNFLRVFAPISYRLLPKTPFALHWPNEVIRPTRTEALAGRAIHEFQTSQRIAHESLDTSDTYLFPIIQAGQFGIREEEHCVSRLFHEFAHLPDAARGVMDLTSGYFALHEPYQDLIINSPANCRIIAAGPKANGFYGSNGVSGRIPEAYTLLEQRFWRKVLDKDRAFKDSGATPGSGTGVELREWEKDGWTYHAKGIWYRSSADSLPQLTLIGSTNLNSRSARLDTELSFIMSTSSSALGSQLDHEVMHLHEGTRRVNEADWEKPSRRVRWGTRALMSAGVRGML